MMDWTGDMCDDYHGQTVYVGFMSVQNERIPDGGSRDGAGGCCICCCLSTRLTESANIRCLDKWRDPITLQYPDGITCLAVCVLIWNYF